MSHFRLLYLTALGRVNGREHFLGRRLYDALHEEASTSVVAHAVWPASRERDVIPPGWEDDLMRASAFAELRPDVIYLERGLTDAPGREWRVPRDMLEVVLLAGAVLVVADVDRNVVSIDRPTYEAAWQLFGTRPRSHGGDQGPVYLKDSENDPRLPVGLAVRPEEMVIASWLRPVYEGIAEVGVSLPVALEVGLASSLASGARNRTGSLHMDFWVDRYDLSPFATVHALGDGFVVLIAAGVSSDALSECCPDNIRWLMNLVLFLRGEVRRDRERRQPLRDLQSVVTAARQAAAVVSNPDEAGDVYARALDPALASERDQQQKKERYRLAETALRSEIGSAWEHLPADARTYLITGDCLRAELEGYTSENPDFDFSAAVATYSKAVEVAALELLFEPWLRLESQALPEPHNDYQQRSIDVLMGYANAGKTPTLGQMAFCIETIGCALRGEDNSFACHLEATVGSLEEFCAALAFPKHLQDYVQTYRNQAAHVGRMSLEQAAKARQLLLDHPPRLLATLARLVAASSGAQ